MPPFVQIVSSTNELEALIGLPSELVIKKELGRLDDHMCEFVGRAPMVLLGTVGANGNCDVSPRGDLPCVAKVLDTQTLLVPERPGNRRADSLRNILQTGRIGLLFLVPGVGETLRVNGRACLTSDETLLAPLSVGGKTPIIGIGIEVEECYFQCAKALIRSKLWSQPSPEPQSAEFNFAKVLVDQTGIRDQSVEALARQIETSYRERLY